jgi:hypothetical protein
MTELILHWNMMFGAQLADFPRTEYFPRFQLLVGLLLERSSSVFLPPLSGQENVLKLHVPLNEQSAKLTISIKHRAKCIDTIDAVCRVS